MINSYKSTIKQLNTINQFMSDNTETLFINIEFYTALMDIRERLQKEMANYELQQRKINSPYAKVLKKRETEMERIRKKDEERKDESIFEEELSLWFD